MPEKNANKKVVPATPATTDVHPIPFSKEAARQAAGALILHNAEKKVAEKAPTVPQKSQTESST